MAKLYLVRRSMETYIGPMDIGHLKQAYRRMEFGLQDEVAASCGEWLAFDDVSALKRRYPELAKVVTEELLGGWGVSENDQIRIIDSTKRKSKSKSHRKRKRSNVVVPTVMFLVVAVALTVLLAKNNKLSSRFFDRQTLPSSGIVQVHVANKDPDKFDAAMRQLLPSLMPKVTKSRPIYEEWIPYVRYYAYRQDGAVTGVSPKLMQGMGHFAAPADCSVQSWMDRWRKIDLEKLATINSGANQYPTEAWSKILFWDPHWIARRSAHGWIEPRNYYEGCLWMARRAIPMVNRTLPNDHQVPELVVRRLDFLINLIKGQRLTNRPVEGVLGYVTCLENAASLPLLGKCEINQDVTDDWKQYLAVVKARAETSLFLLNRAVLNDEELSNLSKLHKVQGPTDTFTNFNYQPEIKHMVSIMLNNGSVDEANRRMKYEFPEIRFVE